MVVPIRRRCGASSNAPCGMTNCLSGANSSSSLVPEVRIRRLFCMCSRCYDARWGIPSWRMAWITASVPKLLVNLISWRGFAKNSAFRLRSHELT